MPVKAEKVVGTTQKDTVITTYTTGLPVAPAASAVSTYVDLAVADQHRMNEAFEELKGVVEYAREQEYDRPSAATGYYYKTLDGKTITYTETSTDIIEGMVALGINSAIQVADFGSNIMDAEWQQILDELLDEDRLTV